MMPGCHGDQPDTAPVRRGTGRVRREHIRAVGAISAYAGGRLVGQPLASWRCWWTGVLALCVLGGGLASPDGHSAERARPVRLGALTDSWGPTPPIVGLRDGLVALGYQENVDFVLGIRFTQGDRTVLPVAVQQLVAAGAALLFADSNSTAQAVQQATTRIPIVFAAVEDPVG